MCELDGIFIIWGDANPGLSKLFAHAVRVAAGPQSNANAAMRSARLHVLMHKKVVSLARMHRSTILYLVFGN